MIRFPVLRSLPLALGIALAAGSLALSQPQASPVCQPAPGYQALIVRIISTTADRPDALVERGASSVHAVPFCYLSAGDTLRVRPGTEATVRLADGSAKTVLFGADFTVPAVRPPGPIDMAIGVLVALSGGDIARARAIATRKLGSLRSQDDVVTLPGMLGLGEQDLDGARVLNLRWAGGKGPFTVTLRARSPNDASEVSSQTQLRSAGIDLRRLPSGPYALTISEASEAPLPLPVVLVGTAAVPSPPRQDPGLDSETQQLLDAVWLLTSGGPNWRLEALSRLDRLAGEGDLNAIAILGLEATPTGASQTSQ